MQALWAAVLFAIWRELLYACRGRACPARGLAVSTRCREVCRGGIYASRGCACRCELPGRDESLPYKQKDKRCTCRIAAGPGMPGPYTSTRKNENMNIIEITDLNAPELAVYTKLTESQLRNKLEPEKGIFIAESPKVIGTALDAGCEPLSFLMERRQIDGPAAGVLARCPGAVVYTADRSVLQTLTGYALTRGVLCAMRRPAPRRAEELCRSASRVAVLEGIVDSTNIGAIFRSATALGVDAVLLSPSCCDPLCRRAVRVSMGTVFQVPWATLGDTPADWPEKGMDRLHAMGFKTAAMALDDRAVSIDDPALQAEKKLAIVLGTEGDGLAHSTIARCDYTVMIPMQHGVDSLNVAAAGAVAFWELRKR